MLKKLVPVMQRYDEINHLLTDPAVIGDNARYRDLMKEYKSLGPLAEKIGTYQKVLDTCEEARSLLDGGGLDREFRELLQEELVSSKEQADALEQENQDLTQYIDELGTVQGIQRIAEDELGLVDPDTVIIVPQQ